MNEETKLKPCPFCGGTNLYYAAGRFYAVECADCGGKVVGTFKTTEEAADAWNTRSQADASQHAPKTTFKEAACSIIEILEQMKKPISDDGKDYLSPSLRSFLEGEITSFLKAKIKNPEQILKAAIEEKESDLAELKAKLARLEEKEGK